MNIEPLKECILSLLKRLDDYDPGMHLQGQTPDWFVDAAHLACYGVPVGEEIPEKQPEQCFEVKQGYEVDALISLNDHGGDHAYVHLSEALTIRRVEDVRREALEEAADIAETERMFCDHGYNTTADGYSRIKSSVKIRDAILALIDTPAPSREEECQRCGSYGYGCYECTPEPQPTPSPGPVAYMAVWPDGGVAWLSRMLPVVPPKNLTMVPLYAAPQPGELRQVAALAWFEGRNSKRWDENPYRTR